MDKQFFSQFFYFCSDSGHLRWKERPRHHFNSHAWFVRWNSKYAGEIARTTQNVNDKYCQSVVRLNCMKLIYSRVVAVMAGIIEAYDDDVTIDHIDGNPDNNHVENLRAVCKRDNLKNKRVYRNSKFGVHGVSKPSNMNKWRVRITDNSGRKVSLGAFDDFFEAVCARKSAEIMLGYHENHGR